jgi:hypothetical protein
VRVREVLVDEAARRAATRIHLARREHHLSQLAADLVAVVVDGEEVVVRRIDWIWPNVCSSGSRSPIARCRWSRGSPRRAAASGACPSPSSRSCDGVEPPRLSRRADVMGDLRRLARELVRRTTSR